MQFSNLLAAVAVATFAGVAQALVELTPVTFATVTVGKEFNISWQFAVGPVTLTLKNGPPKNLQPVKVIASGLPSTDGKGEYLWTPEDTLPADTYAITITDGTTSNFGTQFQLIGATASPTAATGSSTSGSTMTDSTATSASTTGSVTTTATDSSSTAATTGTKTTGSKTSSKTQTGASASSTTAAPGSANGLASPLAMVLLAFAAVLSFN